MIDRIRGIVLREKKMGEADKLLTVLTEQGKVSIMANGSRSLKSHNLSASRCFSYADFTVYEKRGMYWLREADRHSGFFSITEKVERLCYGQYFLELSDTLAVSDSDESRLLRLLLNTLYALSVDLRPYPLIKAVFELKAMALSGFEPMLDGCSSCGGQSETMYLYLMDGILRCAECLKKAEESVSFEEQLLIPINSSVLAAMRYVLLSPIEKVFSFTLADESAASFYKVCERYSVNQIGKLLPTLDFLHGIETI